MHCSKGRLVYLVLMGFLCAVCRGEAECKKDKSPLDELPPHIRQVTKFGQRADFSHDGKRILFIEKTFGDVYEVEIATKIIRPVTHHYYHEGYTRALYLANGDILLSGARKFDAENPTASRREENAELWVLSKDLSGPPIALGEHCSEGPAVSRKNMRIAWTEGGGFWMADIIYENKAPRLSNKKRIMNSEDIGIECWPETQNFRPPDEKELIFSAYLKQEVQSSEVMGLDIATGKVVNYSNADGQYDEPEGIFPDGKYTLVECDKHRQQETRYGKDFAGITLDIYKLALDGSGKTERLTYFNDYAGYKSSNPVVSDDGRYMAFQFAKEGDKAGVGRGILIFDLAMWEKMRGDQELDCASGGQLPRTYEEAVAHLVRTMSEEDKRSVRTTARDDLIKFHFGWGTGIRNDFGLWGDNTKLLESCARKKKLEQIHPDEASMLIIEGVWEALQTKER
ncbi:MAG: hypothetical protein JSW23_11660 [Planctomycetota bacterium]|nr:MAG: hypothetical protein JSW23_11660 [Planctomycetota bacterium]